MSLNERHKLSPAEVVPLPASHAHILRSATVLKPFSQNKVETALAASRTSAGRPSRARAICLGHVWGQTVNLPDREGQRSHAPKNIKMKSAPNNMMKTKDRKTTDCRIPIELLKINDLSEMPMSF